MALTPQEEATLKKVAAKQDKEDAIQTKIDEAQAQIDAKLAEIKAIEDQRDVDIQALNG
jgi:hypothetical protein